MGTHERCINARRSTCWIVHTPCHKFIKKKYCTVLRDKRAATVRHILRQKRTVQMHFAYRRKCHNTSFNPNPVEPFPRSCAHLCKIFRPCLVLPRSPHPIPYSSSSLLSPLVCPALLRIPPRFSPASPTSSHAVAPSRLTVFSLAHIV